MDQIKKTLASFFSILVSVVVAKAQILNTLCLNHKLRKRRILTMIARIEQRQGISSRLVAMKDDRKKRRFWVRPGRTDSWWQNFVDNVVVPEE